MPERRLSDHPFGTYALKGGRASLRAWANGLPDNRPSRWLMSLARRRAAPAGEEPVDVPVFDAMHARLYPRTNRCEKRVFVGEKTWDGPERAAIAEAMKAAPEGRPFVFVDGGANVGMYSLYVIGLARRNGRSVKVLAVEPDPTNLARLRDNLAASAAHEAVVAGKALGSEAGTARMASEQTNRGEVRMADDGGVEVEVAPLLELVGDAGLDHIDVFKLDIEGYELPVLSAYFRDAPKPLWPRRILLEVGKVGESPALQHCLDAGYRIERRMKINALLMLPE